MLEQSSMPELIDDRNSLYMRVGLIKAHTQNMFFPCCYVYKKIFAFFIISPILNHCFGDFFKRPYKLDTDCLPLIQSHDECFINITVRNSYEDINCFWHRDIKECIYNWMPFQGNCFDSGLHAYVALSLSRGRPWWCVCYCIVRHGCQKLSIYYIGL